ncbi:MAG TPA: hypothetical protein VNY36_03675 [Bacteroidia bacterium]|jgi:hypothetical protein|nr:hypothetical protein [Bacteroidia bacterium]
MTNSNVPVPSIKDYLYSLTKGAIGSIPIAGAAAAELFSLIITPPLEKRRKEWMENIGKGLAELEVGSKIDLNSLSDNQEFIDVIIQASTYAIKTSQKEKIEILRNAILNTALGASPDTITRQIFLKLIDDFTPLHLQILHLFADPFKTLDTTYEQVQGTMGTGTLLAIVNEMYPVLGKQLNLLNVIRTDLNSSGLVDLPGWQDMMGITSIYAKRTTNLGVQFLQFIQSPEPQNK